MCQFRHPAKSSGILDPHDPIPKVGMSGRSTRSDGARIVPEDRPIASPSDLVPLRVCSATFGKPLVPSKMELALSAVSVFNRDTLFSRCISSPSDAVPNLRFFDHFGHKCGYRLAEFALFYAKQVDSASKFNQSVLTVKMGLRPHPPTLLLIVAEGPSVFLPIFTLSDPFFNLTPGGDHEPVQS